MDRSFAIASLALLLSLCPFYAGAASDEASDGLVMSSGSPGGGYWSAGARLQEVAKDMGLEVENRGSSGSLENLQRLLDPQSPVAVAFAQADAAQQFFNDNPQTRQLVDVLENIGQECVFVLVGADSGLQDDADLQKKAGELSLGIPSETSGIADTFGYMASLVPELEKVSVVYGNTSAGMEGLDRDDGELDAVMVVHRPKEHSPEVDLAIANPERFAFVEMHDERLTRELPGGDIVYRSMRLALPGVKDPVTTICVRGLLLGHKHKLSADQSNKLTDLVNYHWMRVYATQ